MITRNEPRDTTKLDVIVLALEAAGGASGRVDTEDVAVAAFRLAPSYFSWRKYPDQIDLDAVRTTLRHAAERGQGSRVGGSIKAGWHLTARGLQWLEHSGPATRKALGIEATVQPRPSSPQSGTKVVDLSRLRRSEAFSIWKRGEAVSPRAAAAAFRIDAYTPRRDRTYLIAQLTQVAEKAGDKEICRFLPAMERLALDYSVPGRQMEGKTGD